jgi:hypothetical protein
MKAFRAKIVASLVLIKENHKLGAKVFEQAGVVLRLLNNKSPNIAKILEKVQKEPDLAEQSSSKDSVRVLAKKIENLSKKEPEIQNSIQVLSSLILDLVKSEEIDIDKKLIGRKIIQYSIQKFYPSIKYFESPK